MKPRLTDRVKAALYAFRRGISWKAAPYIWSDSSIGQKAWQIVDYDAYVNEGFGINSVIYAAIMYKAKAFASIPVTAYSGPQDNPVLLPADHPLAKLVDRPNSNQAWAEFAALQMVYLNLHGNAFTYFVRGNGYDQTPTEMWPLRPDRVYIIPGEKGSIKGYAYVPPGRSAQDAIPILPTEMSHVKYPNPADDLEGQGYGFSPLAAAARSADVDNQVTRFLKLFFDQGAMSSGLLSFDVPMDDVSVAKARQRWNELYGGVDNWTSVAVLDQGGKYQRLSLTFQEMGFGELDERSEARILSVLGVPPILIGSRLGLMRSTYANYETARQSFWEDTMTPEVSLWEGDFTYYLQSPDGGFVRFEIEKVPALRNVQMARVQTWATLVQFGVPPNVATRFTGIELPPLPGGDEPMAQGGGAAPAPVPAPVEPVPPAEAETEVEATTDEREVSALDLERATKALQDAIRILGL